MLSRRLMVWCVAGALGLAGSALAQGRGAGCGPGGWGGQGAYWRLFDPGKVETLSGEIVSLKRVRPMRGISEGVHLELKTDRETISVHLGPAWYLDNQDPALQAKDKVEIVGSRVQLDGKPALIASEVRKGEEVLALRGADGTPLWCGWRRR